MRVFIFAGLSILLHLGLSVAFPHLPPEPPEDPSHGPVVASFVTMEPLPAEEPEPEAEPAPAPEPEPRIVRRRAEPEPPPAPAPEPPSSEEPIGTPDATEVVADDQPVVPEATIASTEGGLRVRGRAGAGSAGAIRGTRHEGPVGAPEPQTIEERRQDLRATLISYRSRVQGVLFRGLRRPRTLRRDHGVSTVKVGVTIDASGRVVRVRIRGSSGSEHLDQLALADISQVSSVPAPPGALPWSGAREMTFSVVYR